MKFVWTTSSESHEGQVSSFRDAMDVLVQAAKSPTMVEFFDSDTGMAIALGVGAGLVVVTFQETNDPPYYISLGESNAGEVLEFVYGNEPTEYLARNAVLPAAAEVALEWFFTNGTRPPNLAWERL
jgi:hypothetical protein